MKHWNFQNFKRGPLSTALGVVLMIGSGFIFMKVPNSEIFALALLTAGGIAFGLKDPKLPGQ